MSEINETVLNNIEGKKILINSLSTEGDEDFSVFTCGYCNQLIPNDLDYIRNNHSGNCKKEVFNGK